MSDSQDQSNSLELHSTLELINELLGRSDGVLIAVRRDWGPGKGGCRIFWDDPVIALGMVDIARDYILTGGSPSDPSELTTDPPEVDNELG